MPGTPHTATLAPSTGTASIVVDASVHTVWALVADPTRHATFSPENTGADVLDDLSPGDLRPGTSFTGHNHRDGNTWSTTCTVVERREPHVFAFHAGDDDTGTTWTFRVRDLGPAGTQLSESFDSLRLRHPDWVDALPGRHAQLVRDMQESLAAIRTIAEQDGS